MSRRPKTGERNFVFPVFDGPAKKRAARALIVANWQDQTPQAQPPTGQ